VAVELWANNGSLARRVRSHTIAHVTCPQYMLSRQVDRRLLHQCRISPVNMLRTEAFLLVFHATIHVSFVGCLDSTVGLMFL